MNIDHFIEGTWPLYDRTWTLEEIYRAAKRKTRNRKRKEPSKRSVCAEPFCGLEITDGATYCKEHNKGTYRALAVRRAKAAPRNKAMFEYYMQGHTLKECGDKFGMSAGGAQKVIAKKKAERKKK